MEAVKGGSSSTNDNSSIAKEYNPFPLEGLTRGIDKINIGKSFEQAVKLIEEINAKNTTIRTDQIERKLQFLSPSPSSFPSNALALLDTPDSSVFVVNQHKEAKLRHGAKIIYPTEFLLIINTDPEGPQGNPPTKSVELLTVTPKEKAVPIIEKIIGTKMPTNWKLNPAPHHYLRKVKSKIE